MSVFVHSRNHYRVDLRNEDGRLVAYALMDAFGWSVLARRRGEITELVRFTDTPRLLVGQDRACLDTSPPGSSEMDEAKQATGIGQTFHLGDILSVTTKDPVVPDPGDPS